jgi:hypothetical protein
LKARYAGLATSVEFSIPFAGPENEASLRDLIPELRQG